MIGDKSIDCWICERDCPFLGGQDKCPARDGKR